ncbi:MAG: hypothetical protein ACLFV4_11795 [Candidatus Hydrogenedentota bacterium]
MHWLISAASAIVYAWGAGAWWLFPPVLAWAACAPLGPRLAPGVLGLLMGVGGILHPESPWSPLGHGIMLAWGAGWLAWRWRLSGEREADAPAPDTPCLGPEARRRWILGAMAGLAVVLLVRKAPLMAGLAWVVLALAVPASAGWVPFRKPVGLDRRDRRQVLASGLLLAVSIGLSLAVLEGGARILDLKPETPWVSPFLKKHPERIFTPRPNTSFHYPFQPTMDEKETFLLEISSQGLRDREYGTKEEGEFRILMLGDSFVNGTGLAWEETIPQALERYLHSQGYPQVAVINAGVAGYGPWQERGFLHERGFPLEPDLVLHQIFMGNDIMDTLFRDNRLAETFAPGFVEHLYFYRYRPAWQIALENALAANSRAYVLLLDLLETRTGLVWLMDQLRPFPKPPAYPNVPTPAPRPHYVESNLETWYPKLEEGWERMQADILNTRDDCLERQVDYHALLVSGSYTWCDDAWNYAMDAVEDGSTYERGREIEVAKTFFQEARLPYVPLNAVLNDHPDPCSLYFPVDGHFNAAGAAFTAEVLGEYLLKTGALP